MDIKNIIVCTIGLILLTGAAASSVTRIISVNNDNVYTMIYNSNGKYWEATTANIQKAINDLDNNSGTVWLPGNKTFIFNSTLIIHKNITLDMGGCSFQIDPNSNITMVEMKDGSTIKNGNIDVALHNDHHDSDTKFWEPHSCIYLNASSYIKSATISNMNLESISKGYNEPDYYDDTYTGRGYGIHLHATNVSVPQLITNVNVECLYTRNFYHAIFIQNERHPINNEPGAHIDDNIFERLFNDADSYYINVSRNTNVDRTNCSTSRNVFNLIQFQTGRSNYWGGDEITWKLIITDGYGNIFTNIMGWDHNWLRGDEYWVILTSDTDHCYISGRCFLSTYCINNGQDNTIFDNGDSTLIISSVVTKQ